MNTSFSKYLKIFLSVTLLVAILLGFTAKSSILFSFLNEDLIAKVGSEKITKEEFEMNFQNYKDEMLEKGKIDFEKFNEKEKSQIRKSMFNNLVNEKLMLDYARDLNLEVSDETVARQIKETPLFINEVTGIFDEEKFKEILIKFGKTEKEYISEMKKGLSLYGLFMALNVRAKVDLSIENELILKNLHRKRRIDLIGIDEHSIKVESPSDDEIQKFYFSHQANFKQSGFRSIDYFLLKKENFFDKVKIDEDAIQKNALDKLNSLSHKETRSFINVICNNQEQARKIYDHFTSLNKSDYENAVKNISQVDKIIYDQLKLPQCTTSEMSNKKTIDIPENFRQLIFDEINAEKKVSDPKNNAFGTQIIMLQNIMPLTIKDFQDSEREEVLKMKALEALRNEYSNLMNMKLNGADFVKLSNKYQSKAESLGYFDDDGYFKDNKKDYILDIIKGFNRDLISSTFTLKKDEINILDNRDSEVIVFKLSDINLPLPETTFKIEDVKTEIIAKLIHNKQNVDASAVLEKVFEDYKNNISLEDLEKKYDNLVIQKDVKISNPELIKLNSGNKELEIQISSMIFDFKKDSGEAIKIDDLNRIAILRDWIDDEELDSKVNLLEIISDNIYNSESIELNNTLIKALKERYKVKIYDKNFI